MDRLGKKKGRISVIWFNCFIFDEGPTAVARPKKKMGLEKTVKLIFKIINWKSNFYQVILKNKTKQNKYMIKQLYACSIQRKRNNKFTSCMSVKVTLSKKKQWLYEHKQASWPWFLSLGSTKFLLIKSYTELYTKWSRRGQVLETRRNREKLLFNVIVSLLNLIASLLNNSVLSGG